MTAPTTPATPAAPTHAGHSLDEWWGSLDHAGLLIMPARLPEFFDHELKPLSSFQVQRLRRAVTRMLDDNTQLSAFLDTVLEDICGLHSSRWTKGSRVDTRWSRQSITGETMRPDRLWQGDRGELLPVFTISAGHQPKNAGVPNLGVGRSRRVVARVLEWLRGMDIKIALIANGRQLRLVYAGADHDAHCQWDIALWFEEGKPGAQVTALRQLSGLQALTAPAHHAPPPLVTAILESRKGQGELSAVLGERVRKAVETLIQASHRALDPLWARKQAAPADIYIAATRVVMRMVVIFFAEARELLPRDNALYHGSYGLQGLREELDRASGGNSARLRHRFSAWPRILSLFRLVYHGTGHDELPITSYGGGLFEPGDPDGDAVSRALAALESGQNLIGDDTVHRIIELLTRTRVKVRQGKRQTLVPAPVDFSDLSSEYIGILYEGLLDFELRRAPADDAMVFLNVGDQPVLPFARLDKMTGKELAALFDKLKPSTGKSADEEGEESQDGDDGEDGDEDDGDSDADEGDDANDQADQSEPDDGDEPDHGEPDEPDDQADDSNDPARIMRQSIQGWAERAVKEAKLVRAPRKNAGARALAAYDEEVKTAAGRLVRTVVLPGEWFLVRWGGTRKGSGTFYTRPQLAGPTVRRALRPLLYTPVAEAGDGSAQSSEPRTSEQASSWKPRSPGEILALKVCDPAMGSGSFLISALRTVTDALFQSLHAHDRLEFSPKGTIIRLADGKPAKHASNDLLPVPRDHESFEDLLRARLKRHIVERCIHGVDIDPVAVELARMALWVETMDRELPFEFLDHKLRPGNALVGCFFDRFQDYPFMAWEREGGDKTHTRFVHHFRVKTDKQGKHTRSGDLWTQAIKDVRNDVIKPELARRIESRVQPSLAFDQGGATAEAVHHEARAALESIHTLDVHKNAEKARLWADKVRDNPALRALKRAFDAWCALWFWPGDQLDMAPTPDTLHDLPAETAAMVDELARRYRFFHWELEFPDVFTGPDAGFHAMIGNPPWDIQKPSSMEFFSNLDPLYRTYTKQQALKRQQELFADDAEHEHAWLEYAARFKALSSWVKYVAAPFGDPAEASDGKGTSLVRAAKQSARLHQIWRESRKGRRGYADPEHPFRHQGSADINTYKMFLELGHALLRPGGRLGFLVPSGLYTDNGSKDLRRLFLDRCDWSHVYAFQNERFVFGGIHHSFKMLVTHVTKGRSTEAIHTRFRLGPGDSPTAVEVEHDIEDQSGYLSVPVDQIHRFSPNTASLLEVRTGRDLEIIEKLYGNGVLLGDQGPSGWGIKYATEFHMTNDSRLFPPRPQWEARGYKADEYGHWLKGKWRPVKASGERDWSTVRSADGNEHIAVEDIEDVALPLYEGRMIGAFDFSEKGWVSGKGRTAIWKNIYFENKIVQPQYLVGLETCREQNDQDGKPKFTLGPKIAFMDVTAAINERTMIAAMVTDAPCGNSTPVLICPSSTIGMIGNLNSYAYDYIARARCGGLHLNYFVIADTPLLTQTAYSSCPTLVEFVLRLCAVDELYAREWNHSDMKRKVPWRRLWAVTEHERLRLRAIVDAVVARLYGLELADFGHILRDCDHPVEHVCDKAFARTLDPKGFWRVDKDRPPELRHTVLSLIAFHELEKHGLENFLALSDGDGWMLPDTLRLADYGLGKGDVRAREPQPVAAALGPRFLDWQLAQGVAESWDECARHAALIDQIVPGQIVPGPAEPAPGPESAANAGAPEPEPAGQMDLFGTPPGRKS